MKLLSLFQLATLFYSNDARSNFLNLLCDDMNYAYDYIKTQYEKKKKKKRYS